MSITTTHATADAATTHADAATTDTDATTASGTTRDTDATTASGTATTWQQIDPTWHRTTDPERWASAWMDIDHRWHWSVLTPEGQVAGGVVGALDVAKAEAEDALR